MQKWKVNFALYSAKYVHLHKNISNICFIQFVDKVQYFTKIVLKLKHCKILKQKLCNIFKPVCRI
jgi:hypothetical protein